MEMNQTIGFVFFVALLGNELILQLQLSADGGSAWAWSEKRRQYYYHRFTPEQPDLNYRCKALVQEIKDVLIFWLDKGVDGFAMGSVSFLFEHEEFKDDSCTENQPETYAMVYQFRELLDDYSYWRGGDARYTKS